MTKKLIPFVPFLFVVFGMFANSYARSLTIIANPGPFSNIRQAAISEQQIDFWDGKPEDDNACREK